jgi:hypothetical protein
MLFTIAIVLIILWALGFFVIPVGGSLIHILLVIALIVIIYRLVTGRKPVRRGRFVVCRSKLAPDNSLAPRDPSRHTHPLGPRVVLHG